MEETNKRHVAWADRIGLNKQWARDIESCSDSFGTSGYPLMVQRFKSNIPNIKEGANLYDQIVERERELFNVERKNLIKEWEEYNPQEASNESFRLQKYDEIELELNKILYHFIIQTLENNGFGFYKSSFDGAYEEMQ